MDFQLQMLPQELRLRGLRGLRACRVSFFQYIFDRQTTSRPIRKSNKKKRHLVLFLYGCRSRLTPGEAPWEVSSVEVGVRVANTAARNVAEDKEGV